MSTKHRVLYIEDDAKARTLVSKVLSRDFEVVTAPNGIEGLDILQRNKLDLVLTDINLPDLSGEVIATRIRAVAGLTVPIVAVSAHTDKGTRQRALAAGCVGYITKPINSRTLVSTLHDILGGERAEPLSESEQKVATQEIQAALTDQLEKTMRQLQKDNAELRNLERTKSAFLTQVSHELRTPLTILSGYVQMLNQHLQGTETVDETARELAQMSENSIKRLHALMNEVVVMARLASDQVDASFAPTRLDIVAADAIEEYEPAFTIRKINFQKAGSGWTELIQADRVLIRMALSNLLSNAIKFTPDGGTVTMRVEREEHKLHISVEDTGVGVAEENLSLLFNPFFTTIDVSLGSTSKTQFMGMGMGMGLTIVSKVIGAHKGQVWAESPGYDEEKFPGTTFHILLPAPILAEKVTVTAPSKELVG